MLDAILNGNFEAADQAIVSADLPAATIAELTFLNDALRQRYYASTQDPDPYLCRIYLDYLAEQAGAPHPERDRTAHAERRIA